MVKFLDREETVQYIKNLDRNRVTKFNTVKGFLKIAPIIWTEALRGGYSLHPDFVKLLESHYNETCLTEENKS